MSRLVVALWMNAGFSGATMSTYSSTVMSNWAYRGSFPGNAASIICRAWAMSASGAPAGREDEDLPVVEAVPPGGVVHPEST